jgi:hypothetical protein
MNLTDTSQKKYKWPIKCSISSAIGKMQIKPILMFHLTPVRMVIIKKKLITAIDKVAGRKRNPYTLLVVM